MEHKREKWGYNFQPRHNEDGSDETVRLKIQPVDPPITLMSANHCSRALKKTKLRCKNEQLFMSISFTNEDLQELLADGIAQHH